MMSRTLVSNPNLLMLALSETEAAAYLHRKPSTLRGWRSKSRARGYVIGPRWCEERGSGGRCHVTYPVTELQAYRDASMVDLPVAPPVKRQGRPRKGGQ